MKLKIMTYNIASGHTFYTYDEEGKVVRDISGCARVIGEESPDICGINEINIYDEGEDADQPRAIASLTEFEHSYFSKANQFPGRAYGNAVLSRLPMLSVETVRIPDPTVKDEYTYYESRAIAKVKIDIAGGITLLQTHFGLAVSEKQNAVDTLCRLIDETDSPIILMGDFNIRPSDYLHRAIRERLFDTADITDTYITTYPTYKRKIGESADGAYTGIHPDCKIDYIYVSEHFKTVSVKAINTKASDHYPLVAEVEI